MSRKGELKGKLLATIDNVILCNCMIVPGSLDIKPIVIITRIKKCNGSGAKIKKKKKKKHKISACQQ